MQSKHTPGPWAINHDINALNVCRDEPFTDIGLCYGADCTGSTPGLEEGRANARLLAAAPEMLEVCLAVAELLESPGDWQDNTFECFVDIETIRKAHAILAKINA